MAQHGLGYDFRNQSYLITIMIDGLTVSHNLHPGLTKRQIKQHDKNNMKKIAIIGAGRAGLVSAKYAVENGLEPIIFERTDQIGGLWSRGNGTHIWEGLFSNISKYTMMFHDHPWPKSIPIFPEAKEVQEYLISYAKKFDLQKHIHFNVRVDKVKQLSDKKWELNILDLKKNSRQTLIFDFLVVASGLHSKPRIPNIQNSSQFNGIQIHSSSFSLKDPQFKNKNVVVVGCSLSGTEISASLVGHAKSVTNVFPRTYLITPRLIKFKTCPGPEFKILPVDVGLNRRSFNFGNSSINKEELEQQQINMLYQIFPYQTDKTKSHPDLFIDLKIPNQVLLKSISDYYIQHVQENKIRPVKTKIKSFNENSVILENGEEILADAIIYCTGYELVTDFFDSDILKTLKFDNEQNYKFSVILYKCAFHPDLENLAFVGQTEGSYFTGDELIASWACRIFTGKTKLPQREAMIKEIEIEEKRRGENIRLQYTHGSHAILIEKLAKASGQMPDIEHIRKTDPVLYDILWDTAVTSNHFFLNENYMDILNEIKEMNKRNFALEKNWNDITLEDLKGYTINYYTIY
ncbi:Flavin containing monooxygenase [Brachionus plicatilis]|uniref:Flavin-containing monooxygenase n=1 Tax=Brachionus plicatilis TaxID=10195 RepID=A0A3M7SAM5_BRAPC|nr:Flavin containing monooxygenase [Brachionus plicatilis]